MNLAVQVWLELTHASVTNQPVYTWPVTKVLRLNYDLMEAPGVVGTKNQKNQF